MAIAVSRQWVNGDGLIVRFGPDKALQAQSGQTQSAGAMHHVICTLEASRMALDGGFIGDYPNTPIAPYSYITRAIFVVTEAFDSGSTATLDLGLGVINATTQLADYTGADEDGIDAAIAETAIDTAGKAVICDGALVAATSAALLAVTTYPTYDVDTAVYTTGKGWLFFEYMTKPYTAETPG